MAVRRHAVAPSLPPFKLDFFLSPVEIRPRTTQHQSLAFPPQPEDLSLNKRNNFMRSIHLFTILGLLASAAAVRADDDFLKPDNWEGLKDLWKIDGTTIVGETKIDPKFNTFFCSKTKYKD